jgi:ribulose 1,5-bisphosphate synthetase/thiazole synthase
MSPGRWQPSLVMDRQVLVTHADRVTLMEREIGHPPRIIRGSDVCDLFQARDEERLPGLVDRWESCGIAAQVVHIPPTGDHDPAIVLPPHHPATHR